MWIDIDQASAKLNVSRRTLQRRISENKIKSKIDGNRRIVWLEETDDTPTTKENESLKKQVEDLLNQVGQLSDKLARLSDNTIKERERHDIIIMKLTQQLENSQHLIEDMRRNRSIFARIRDVFVPSNT